MYEVWTSRKNNNNNNKYHKTQLPQETIITKIVTHLRNIQTNHTLQTTQTK